MSLVVFNIFAQQLQETVRVLANDGCNLWVSGGNLLQNGLEHLWLLLHELAELLEMWVAAQEVQVSESITGSSSGSSSSTTTATASLSRLSRSFEQVQRLLASGSRTGCWSRDGCRSLATGGFLLLGLMGLLLILLNVVGNALFAFISWVLGVPKEISANAHSRGIQWRDLG